MRIGYDAKRAFKNYTGLGNYSRSIISIMAQFYPANEYLLYTPPYKSHTSNVFASSSNISICQPKSIWRSFHSVWRSYRLSKEIEQGKIDIFHGLSHELPVGIKHTGAKSIVTMHDLIVLRYPHLYNYIDRKIYLKKYHTSCKYADLIIAISQQTKNDLINLMGVDEHKIRLVYQGCDPQFYILRGDAEKQIVKQKYNLPNKYILNVGTIEPRKRLAIIVKALAKLPDDVHLVAIGKSTNYMSEVQKEVKQHGLEQRVHILSGVQFADLPAIYQQAQVFVYPSIFEGFGIPILEALNSRTPVIAANSSSLPEVGGIAALYIDIDNDVMLAQYLQNVLTNSYLRNNMIENGIVQAFKFREKEVAQALWAVYNELVN